MLLSVPLSLGFSRLMGSVNPYLNTSWTSLTGMLLFVSKMHCHHLSNISKNKWSSWQPQTVPGLAWQAMPSWCACRDISPTMLAHVPGGSTTPLAPSRLAIPCPVCPNSSLPIVGDSLGHQPHTVRVPVLLSQAVSLPPSCWGRQVTGMRRWVTGKASLDSSENHALASSLLEKTLPESWQTPLS